MMADNKGNRMSKRRSFFIALLVMTVFGIYALRLFQIQIVEGEAYNELATRKMETKISIAASRGEILDRYLRPIAVNATSNAVLFDYNYFPRGTDDGQQKLQNDIILRLVTLLGEAEETWNDTLPITRKAPYAFEEERDASIAALKKNLNMADYATAEHCMKALVEAYHLAGYTAEEQRAIAGVRYEMSIRDFTAQNAYVFSSGVSRETMYKIMENNTEYPGVDVQATPVRKYVQGDVAAHLIGQVGPIYAEEYEELKEKGYALNDKVGKGGIEAAMEDSLRGTTGTRTLVKDAKGNVLEEKETKAPVPGKSVVLTIDTDLQAKVQQILKAKFEELRAKPATKGGKFADNGHDVKSGSVVMLDVSDGGVLVCASWPSFDLATYGENYAELVKDPDKPLFNRALNGAFPFGSTAKPAVALAAFSKNELTPSTHITCDRRYRYYEDYQPTCMGRHGSIDVATALSKSCNVFFYDTGRRTGIDTINKFFNLFGLCQKTGVEIGESPGYLDSPEAKKNRGDIWTGGDTLRAAIGQTSNVTPIQLATYAMTLANDGVRYKTHLVHSVRSYDGLTDTVVQPEVVSRADLSKEAIDTVRKGMVEVVKSGTASRFFNKGNLPYTLAAKTGTAQIVEGKTDNGIFIAYGPVEKPEVAVAVVMEQGTSAASSEVARQVLDAYFAGKTDGLAPTPPAQLLP